MPETAWERLRADEINALAQADAIVLLPVASTEQHGPHLPTGVDTLLCTAVCDRAAALMQAQGEACIRAPAMPVGLAAHHMPFGGSLTLSLTTWHALLRDMCLAIGAAGFSRIVIVNGHGGNASALNALSGELAREVPARIAVTTYFSLAEAEFAAILEDQRGVLHACEAETSMMLALAQDLVRRDALPQAFGPPARDAAAVLGAPMHRWRDFTALTQTGVIGDARRADPGKGEKFLAAAAKALAAKASDPALWT
ncbi:MAG: creatininase family protein [Salinarimonas sp.]|nr:creatininase family protein [Salinarimonas sp.]